MVSVIIPVLNEGATIRKVIRIIRQSSLPLEVILVDDNSTDNTIAEARKENVRIITSSRRGKGLSMREGLLAAKFETVVYLDGDIITYPPDVVDLLANPILSGEADFVKSTFKRQAGRVTQLVAKPLLSILFPELGNLEQPLSGMIAAKKSFLEKVTFENDYGVDVGLLIDVHRMKARIRQVNIGRVQNAMQSLENLGKMSKQVTRTILNKADAQSLQTLGHIDLINRQMESAVLESIDKMEKMVLLEMNHLVLDGHFGQTASRTLGLAEGYEAIEKLYQTTPEKLSAVASLFAGTSLPTLLEIADDIPLVPGIRELIYDLKKRGYSVGLITEQFSCVANHLKNVLGFDFVVCNTLVLSEGIATGEIEFNPFFTRGNDIGTYGKQQVFSHIQERYNLRTDNIIYVTANRNDRACIDAAGIGVLIEDGDLAHLENVLPGQKKTNGMNAFRKPIRPASVVLPAVMLTAVGVMAWVGWKTFIKKALPDDSSAAPCLN
ncbi:glycosyltransferase [Flavihumibacter petaseus]|uniref:Putative glycosyltransferase/hydrolase n=1 Tax=Flavihumibacter petaseus NBRC 106054 TaxID=1220578 RepID=A0A0E9N585_9BACT|nr:glycosyltransferase [Flavihumibacter petaseus]GAO44979.1 putative glycosyltransferase/hydrolase [Flavihumibacter petaseus NBRC 106054]